MIISNTLYKLTKRRLCTWVSPAHTSLNIIQNRINYILVNKKYKNAILSVYAHPCADGIWPQSCHSCPKNQIKENPKTETKMQTGYNPVMRWRNTPECEDITYKRIKEIIQNEEDEQCINITWKTSPASSKDKMKNNHQSPKDNGWLKKFKLLCKREDSTKDKIVTDIKRVNK